MTKQRRLILEIVESTSRHLTADEVYIMARDKIGNIGLGTVYRNLNCLCNENLIRRVEMPEGPDRFDRNLSKHEHMRCTRCGRLIDCNIDMEEIIRPLKEKGLHITGYDLQFSGICKDCLAEIKKEKENADG